MSRIRWWIYKLGFRPSHGSIFYSPSLALCFLLTDGGPFWAESTLTVNDHIRTDKEL